MEAYYISNRSALMTLQCLQFIRSRCKQGDVWLSDDNTVTGVLTSMFFRFVLFVATIGMASHAHRTCVLQSVTYLKTNADHRDPVRVVTIDSIQTY